MKKIVVLIFFAVQVFGYAQQTDPIVAEENVTRIIKALSDDAMLGRPAMIPERIAPATAFIENEFKKIGLQPLNGLNGFRQEFEKEKISIAHLELKVDGALVEPQHVLLVSDKKEVNIDNLPVLHIAYDTTAPSEAQFFFMKAIEFLQDSTSALMLIAPQYQKSFQQFKSYFNDRFTDNKEYVKVFAVTESKAISNSIRAFQNFTKIKMTNVAGMLPGKTKPEELVIFSGHYDHIGVLHQVNGDSIANGADDDASGTTAVIELARYFKKMNNKRSLIFVAFTAEEIGGYGSIFFSQQLNPDKVIAMFNIEMIGKPSKWGQNSAFITGYERSDFGAILQKNLNGTQFTFHPDPYPQQNLFYRSDNATLARLGVPAHTISTDQIDTDKLYHSVDDEFESMDIKNITATIKAIALSSRSIVDGIDTPKRIDKSTVK